MDVSISPESQVEYSSRVSCRNVQLFDASEMGDYKRTVEEEKVSFVM